MRFAFHVGITLHFVAQNAILGQHFVNKMDFCGHKKRKKKQTYIL